MTVPDIAERLQDYVCLGGYECLCDSCALHAEAAAEIERLRAEVLELRGVVRAHEGLYARAAEEIDKQRGWIERTYRMAVGHGPNWNVFDNWEEAINAYEEASRG